MPRKVMKKPMYKRFSQAERALALKWARQGKQTSKIASLLDRDPGTISRQLAKPKSFVPKLGRSKIINEAVFQKLNTALDALIKKAKAEKEVTLTMVKKRARVDACDLVCRAAFKAHGIRFFQLREKPILTDDDIVERRAFQREHGSKSKDAWNGSPRSGPHAIIDNKHFPMYPCRLGCFLRLSVVPN